jgi:hypothetical protein
MIRPLIAAILATYTIQVNESPAGVIRVPHDVPTIQAGIDSSCSGSTGTPRSHPPACLRRSS